MAVNITTARADIFKEFYAVIKDNLVSVDVKVTNSFVDDVAAFPMVVITKPLLPRTKDGFGKGSFSYDRSGNINVEIYANSTQRCVELTDEVEDIIFSNLDAISVQNLGVGDSSEASIELSNSVSIKSLILPFAFKFRR